MKTQAHSTWERGWFRRLRGAFIATLVLFSDQPATGFDQEDIPVVSPRKAKRAYLVVHRPDRARPEVLRAIHPVSRGGQVEIPRATVLRPAPRALRTIAVRPSDVGLLPDRRTSNLEVARQRGAGLADGFPSSPSPASLVRRCDVMALEGLKYVFGGDDPSTGGLDCSGAVQYLLRQEGIRDVPRTAYTQYQWLEQHGTLNKVSRWSWSKECVASRLRPGDLMFWTGTYDTGKSPNISHVMIYLGRDANNGKHYMFGASSRRSKGLHGNAVDVYEFVYPHPHGKDNFAGFGSVPGLRR